MNIDQLERFSRFLSDALQRCLDTQTYYIGEALYRRMSTDDAMERISRACEAFRAVTDKVQEAFKRDESEAHALMDAYLKECDRSKHGDCAQTLDLGGPGSLPGGRA
jgi:hypothetical protein